MKYVPLLSLLIYAFFLSSCTQNTTHHKYNQDINRLNDSALTQYKEVGRSITKSSFLALSEALFAAIDEGGSTHALKFCKLQAQPITDSLSLAFQAKISRLSKKNRNPENQATKEAKSIIDMYEKNIQMGNTAHDTLIVSDEHLNYYAPIFIAPACLQCHGEPAIDFTEKHAQMIQELYPKDKATGYHIGDLRGVWHVQFDVEQP